MGNQDGHPRAPDQLDVFMMSEVSVDGVRDEASGARDPRHVFLGARDVMRRYGWGKTKGYQNLKDRDLVPPPAMTRPDRWRLDQLLAWEDRRIAAVESELRTVPEPRSDRLQDLLPPRKRVPASQSEQHRRI